MPGRLHAGTQHQHAFAGLPASPALTWAAEALPKQLLTIFTSHSEKTDTGKAFRALHGREQVGSQNPHQPVDWPGFSELPPPV